MLLLHRWRHSLSTAETIRHASRVWRISRYLLVSRGAWPSISVQAERSTYYDLPNLIDCLPLDEVYLDRASICCHASNFISAETCAEVGETCKIHKTEKHQTLNENPYRSWVIVCRLSGTKVTVGVSVRVAVRDTVTGWRFQANDLRVVNLGFDWKVNFYEISTGVTNLNLALGIQKLGVSWST